MRLIWATRGRSWGFRFLRDGGFEDPLPAYLDAFADVGEAESACMRVGDRVAARLPDPLGRRDAAGRVIAHDFVVFPPGSEETTSLEEVLQVVWPTCADEYARVWGSTST
jgi:hypothetical protein